MKWCVLIHCNDEVLATPWVLTRPPPCPLQEPEPHGRPGGSLGCLRCRRTCRYARMGSDLGTSPSSDSILSSCPLLVTEPCPFCVCPQILETTRREADTSGDGSENARSLARLVEPHRSVRPVHSLFQPSPRLSSTQDPIPDKCLPLSVSMFMQELKPIDHHLPIQPLSRPPRTHLDG